MSEELHMLEEQASELKVEARFHREEKHMQKNLGRQQLQKMQAKVADLEEKLTAAERRGEMRSHEVRLEQRKELQRYRQAAERKEARCAQLVSEMQEKSQYGQEQKQRDISMAHGALLA